MSAEVGVGWGGGLELGLGSGWGRQVGGIFDVFSLGFWWPSKPSESVKSILQRITIMSNECTLQCSSFCLVGWNRAMFVIFLMKAPL